MDRRKFIGAAGIATAAVLTGKALAANSGVATTLTHEPPRQMAGLEWNTDLDTAAKQMLAESGEMWLSARDRTDGKNPILITDGSPYCIEITRHGDHWVSTPRRMTRSERRGVGANALLAVCSLNFFNVQGNGDIHCYRTRAYVKNGRKPEWTISIENVVIKGVTAIEVTRIPVSPIEAERKTS